MRLTVPVLVAGALMLSACGVAPTQVTRSSSQATGASARTIPADVEAAVRSKLEADYGQMMSLEIKRTAQSGKYTFHASRILAFGQYTEQLVDGVVQGGVVTVTSVREVHNW